MRGVCCDCHAANMLCRQQYDLDCEMACLGRKGLNSLEKKVRKGDYF